MYLRNGFYALLSSLFLMCLISCLGGNDETEYFVSDDAQITSFSIAHDSIAILAKTKFSIDQTDNEGKIYNYDSLPYLTNIYERVKVTFTCGSGVSYLMTVVDSDTVWIASGDSIDVSNPVQFIAFAPDGEKKKEYRLTVNIHQIDPDSVQYTQVATNEFLSYEHKILQLQGVYYAFVRKQIPPVSGLESVVVLYQSTDMENWESVSLNGFPNDADIKGIQGVEVIIDGIKSNRLFAYTAAGDLYVSWDEVANWYKKETEYPVVSVLGYLKPVTVREEKDGRIAFIVKKDGVLVFAFSETLLKFESGETVPENFPLSGFSVINNENGDITLVGGKSQAGDDLDMVWSTETGLYWSNLSSNPQGNLPVVEGSAFVYNDKEIWYIGGKRVEDGAYNKEIYYSLDGGLVWKTKETKAQFPVELSLRTDASVLVDNQGLYFYIIGGKNQSVLTDIWKGLLNSRTFAR
ncbi:MAG: DUF6242 domain-containing protein [Dysgonamonadaceae bacterium]|jgi:hypothetical protein|nr:DUF6242 domain-containing protein [Dysgonamonadaceae bacterium]